MTSLSNTRPVPRIGLNRTEVAMAIGVSADSVDMMVQEGTLPRPRLWRSRKIWLVAEIEVALTEWPADGQTAPQGSADDENWEAD